MPIDPAAPTPISPEGRQADRYADHERRLKALERRSSAIPVGDDAPTIVLPDGSQYAQRAASRLWLYLDGQWQYAQLTRST